jgi:hypothetical protein
VGRKLLEGLGPDPLGWAQRGSELWKFPFQLDKSQKLLVVLCVADGGIVEDIVVSVMFLKKRSEF